MCVCVWMCGSVVVRLFLTASHNRVVTLLLPARFFKRVQTQRKKEERKDNHSFGGNRPNKLYRHQEQHWKDKAYTFPLVSLASSAYHYQNCKRAIRMERKSGFGVVVGAKLLND